MPEAFLLEPVQGPVTIQAAKMLAVSRRMDRELCIYMKNDVMMALEFKRGGQGVRQGGDVSALPVGGGGGYHVGHG